MRAYIQKFNNKYRSATARATWWNYNQAAAYFITICTENRVPFFGRIANAEMQLNDMGRVVEQEWIKTPGIRPDMHLSLGEFVVMPEHFHGIIGIGENGYNNRTVRTTVVGTPGMASPPAPGMAPQQSMAPQPKIVNNQFGPQSKNLASIIRGFKSAVTISARKINPAFGWQSRFHERIIRDEKEYERIAVYIRNNPLKG